MRVLTTRWRRKPAGTDMDRNYVTVTLCVKKHVRWDWRPVRGALAIKIRDIHP